MVMPTRWAGAVFSLALTAIVMTCSLPVVADTWIVAIPAEGYPPYIITPGTPGVGELEQAPTGIVIEVLKIAAARENIDLVFRELPELRAQKMLDEGEVDVRMESPHWVEHPENYLWSDMVTSVNDVFVFAAGAENYFETDEDILGAEIVTHLGYRYPTLEPLFDRGDLIRNDRQTEGFMLTAIVHGRYVGFETAKRAAVMDRLVAQWLMQREPRYQGQFRFSNRLVASAPVQFMVARKPGHAELVSRINRQIERLRSRGVVEDITHQMISLPATVPTP
ncbi:amino acid ABC transporter substrate-binding protein, PAAT family [Marinobacter zhejiangensis]|uniref:Amino acid ABC transporter substrate-binding protein, PAAT family n=2 Tax=Marinobacter zhejiangensis TaxID=488535 RepID=A0A1I4Q578_9GAMM|nr:amino acid ABC transporter substrate-binding protein, PAAT family [Marinobacter zhejiangensis]